MAERQLPAPFAELEPFLSWSLATERERTAKRQTQRYGSDQGFYDAMLPRLGGILPYLNDFPLGEIPDDVERLFLLSMSLAEVAPAVEQLENHGGGAGRIDRLASVKSLVGGASELNTIAKQR
jgi:hypothetical protein